jgi:methylglyoxal synthase
MKVTVILTLALSMRVDSASPNEENALLQTGRRNGVSPKEHGGGPDGKFPMPVDHPIGADIFMKECTPEDSHKHLEGVYRHSAKDGSWTSEDVKYSEEGAAEVIQRAYRDNIKGIRNPKLKEAALLRKIQKAFIPPADCKTCTDDYVHTGKSNKIPCQRCIEESDPGVYKRDKARWDTFPSLIKDDKGILTPTVNQGWAFATQRNEWWGAGHRCCRDLKKEDIENQPLCGICLRYHANGLGGRWSFEKSCAALYCAPDGYDTDFQVTASYIGKLAAKCGGMVDLDGHSGDYDKKAIGHPEEMGRGSVFDPEMPYPTHYLAVVANNPRKKDLSQVFHQNRENLISYLQGRITGTGSSSAQCATDLKEERMKGGATTTSGPFGGDVQCGGIIAEDYVRQKMYRKERAIEGLVFLNDEREPHRLDIIALKKIIEFAMPREQYSFHELDSTTPAEVIEHVADINKKLRQGKLKKSAITEKMDWQERVAARQHDAESRHVTRIRHNVKIPSAFQEDA